MLVAGCLPSQPPPFERHPHPAGDEGNATAKVAPSGLGQCHVVEPESARTPPGSHDTQGRGLLERAQVWSIMRDVRAWERTPAVSTPHIPSCLSPHAPLSTIPCSAIYHPAVYHPREQPTTSE